jgi:uncharacterized membrane protein YkoI
MNMRNKDVEQKIYEEFNQQKPELYQQILEQCPKMKERPIKSSIWTRLRSSLTNHRFTYSFASLATIFILLFVLVGLPTATTNSAPYSVIALDVNPSVVLELEENDKVANVITGNEDANIILGEMNLIGVDLDVAIYALIGSMLTNGYISDISNSVLLSVQSNDKLKEEEILSSLTKTINDLLTGSSINGSIVTQTLELSDEAEEVAEELNISEAKAELILRIIAIDPRMTKEALALISINDLNLLLEAKNYMLDNVKHTGSASTLELISVQDAYNLALIEVELDASIVLEYEVELEQEDGLMIYEIDIETASMDYFVVINAKTGAVIFTELEEDEEYNQEDYLDDVEILPIEELLLIIASKLNLNQSTMSELEFELGEENGYIFYEVSFEYNSLEYELEVDAVTGYIYSNSQDEDGYNYDEDEDEYDD